MHQEMKWSSPLNMANPLGVSLSTNGEIDNQKWCLNHASVGSTDSYLKWRARLEIKI